MKFYVTHTEWPTSPEVLAAALAAGCAQVRHTDALPEGVHEEADPAPRVPEFVTRRQAKRALLDAELYAAAEAAILAAGDAAEIDWRDADTFRRDNPLIEAMRLALGLTHAQVDDLFRAAALIA